MYATLRQFLLPKKCSFCFGPPRYSHVTKTESVPIQYKFFLEVHYFDQHLHAKNDTENMTAILQYLSYFSALLVIQDRVYFDNNISFHNLLFSKLETF